MSTGMKSDAQFRLLHVHVVTREIRSLGRLKRSFLVIYMSACPSIIIIIIVERKQAYKASIST